MGSDDRGARMLSFIEDICPHTSFPTHLWKNCASPTRVMTTSRTVSPGEADGGAPAGEEGEP